MVAQSSAPGAAQRRRRQDRTRSLGWVHPELLLVDCYNTLVEGDRPVIQGIVAAVAAETGLTPRSIDLPWWKRFSALCAESVGDAFSSQRELEIDALGWVLAEQGRPLARDQLAALIQPLVDYWRTARPFPDAIDFLASWDACPVVVCSNIDRADLTAVLAGMPLVSGVVTSQDARAYKPNPLIFAEALRRTGVDASRAVHIGDSWESDVQGALAAGVRPILLDRVGPGSAGVSWVRSLADLPALLASLR